MNNFDPPKALCLTPLVVGVIFSVLAVSAPVSAQEVIAAEPSEVASRLSEPTATSRFSPRTVAAHVDEERAPSHVYPADMSAQVRRRRVRLRRAAIATAVLGGVVAAVVGVVALVPESRPRDTSDDGAKLLGLLLLLGG